MKKTMKRQASNDEDEEKLDVDLPQAPKRQRVSRACDQCRAAREKCDGIQPLCFPCASQNRLCSWEEPKKKRGVQTGYIRALELALGWMFDKIPGSEESLHGLLTHEGGQGRALLLGKDAGAGNRLHRRWRKSTVHKEIDRVLSGGDTSNAKSEKQSPTADDSDSGEEADAQPHATGKRVPPEPRDASSSTALDPDDPALKVEPGPAPPGVATLESDRRAADGAFGRAAPLETDMLRLPPNCWRLLDIYFSYTHCWFPILEKALIHKTCWSYPAEGIAVSNIDSCHSSAAHAELWAALALAAFQDEASQAQNPQATAEGQLSARAVYEAARRLLPSETDCLDARYVNALLLLAMVKIGQREPTPAWVLIGWATRIALSPDLQLNSVGGEGSRRPQLAFLACFVLDTLVSTQLRRPPHLRAEDAQAAMPSGEADQDEWDSWNPCPGFGPPRPPSASRSPAHSISSFGFLYGIHRIHSGLTFGLDHAQQQREPFPIQVQRALGSDNTRQPLSKFIMNGGSPPTQLPSIQLLRLAFLCYGGQAQVYPDSLPATILQCVEEHIMQFGVCSIPPLFSSYIALLGQHCNVDLLKPEIRDRWKAVERAIDSVWTSTEPRPVIDLAYRPPEKPPMHYVPSTSSVLYYAAPNTQMAPQQLPTPSAHYAETPTDQPPLTAVGELYHDGSTTNILDFPDVNRPRPSINFMNHLTTNVAGPSAFDLSDVRPHPYAAHARPSFSSATFDYDAILDDIASLDRADRMGSDPQFMANLGFAPGSDLAELLTQDFSGIS